jgi:hypothetical protein
MLPSPSHWQFAYESPWHPRWDEGQLGDQGVGGRCARRRYWPLRHPRAFLMSPLQPQVTPKSSSPRGESGYLAGLSVVQSMSLAQARAVVTEPWPSVTARVPRATRPALTFTDRMGSTSKIDLYAGVGWNSRTTEPPVSFSSRRTR